LLARRSLQVGDFELTSGRRSDYYIDCRTTTMHAQGLVLLGRVGLDAITRVGWAPDTVGGLTMGADPIAYAIAAESWRSGSPIHAFSLRKRGKRHGRGRLIEGCFEPGARAVIVEDVITTGGSVLRACEAVHAERGEVLGVIGLVDREEGGKERIMAAGMSTIVLSTATELKQIAAGGAAAGVA